MAPLLYDIKFPLCPTNYAGAVWIEYSTTLGIGNWTLLEKLDPVSRRQKDFFKVQYPIPAGSQFNRTRLVPPFCTNRINYLTQCILYVTIVLSVTYS